MSIWASQSKDRLALLARGLADLQIAWEDVLPEEMPGFQSFPVRQPGTNSLYTPPRRRASFAPSPIVASVLDPADVRALRAVTLEQLGLAITPAKIQRFVGQFLNGNRVLHVCDLPPDAFEQEEDLPWLVYTTAYGGLNILAQLRTQASPRFAPYRMDCDTLDAHARWAHPLSAADERRLARLKRHPHLADVVGLIGHVLHGGMKLEQEAVRVGR